MSTFTRGWTSGFRSRILTTTAAVCLLWAAGPSSATAFNFGACCNDTTHTCTEGLIQTNCEGGGGRFGGVGSTCDDIFPVCECTPVDCDDGIACTDDECSPLVGDPITGCLHTPIDANCDDGVACTDDVCDPDNGDALTGCLALPNDANCDDGVACTNDVCDAVDNCRFTPNDTKCDDGVACTNDTCDALNDCQFTPNDAKCDDGVGCTIDTCDALDDCRFIPDDSQCVDGVDCTDDSCDALNDCQFTPNDGLCDDGVDCTNDTCDAANGCEFAPNDAKCSDGVFCNGDEICDADLGGCVEDTEPCSSSQVCCETTDTCEAECCFDSQCPDNGVFCDGPEVCEAGRCVSAGTPCFGGLICCEASASCAECCPGDACGDGDVCTKDRCLEGVCTHTNLCGSCCFGSGSCADDVLEGACQGGTFLGIDSTCAGDNDGDGFDDGCEVERPIPTVSEWGLLILTLLVLTIAKVCFGHRRRDGTPTADS